MKKKLISASLLASLGMLLIPLPASADLIYAWDFLNLPATTSSTATPGIIASTVGSGGVLDVSAFDLGSPQGSSPERTAFTGTTVNSFPGSDSTTSLPTQSALAIANQSANGKSMVFSFSMVGYEDLVVTFATRGTGTGFDTGTWSWSTDGVNYTTLAGVNTATHSSSFAVATADFTSETGLNGVTSAYLEYTLSGATSGSGNNRLDNIQFNATPVPEPATLGLSILGGLALLGLNRRRKHS